MRYDPKKADRPVIAPGVYDGEVTTATDGTNKKGQEMLTVTVTVFDPATQQNARWPEYFTANNAYRLKRMCEATGIDFEGGEVTADMVHGQACRVHVRVEQDKSGQYGPQNRVAKWESPQSEPAAAVTAPASTEPPTIPDDDIPF